MKNNFKLFCFGFGQVAKYFVRNLIKKNYNFSLATTNTQHTKCQNFDSLKYKSYYFLNDKFDEDLLNELDSSNKILVSIPPKDGEDVVLKIFDNKFKKNNFEWITYLSATSVYGDKKGKYVDEKTKPIPTTKRGLDRLTTENAWLKYYKNFSLPVQIFRLSGIYSIERNIIKKIQRDNINLVEKKNHFFSRINVEDIAEILTLSLEKFSSGEIFNISDDYPCSNDEITKYTANLINKSIPKKIKLEDVQNHELKDFYKDSKKVSNKKMKKFFNYNLKYPTFKEGLAMIKNHIT